MRKCLLLASIALSTFQLPVLAAKTKHTQYAVIHPSLGKFRFSGRMDEDPDYYQLRIHSSRRRLIQEIRFQSNITSLGYDFSPVSIYDVDGDGYKDIVIIAGYGAGPNPSTSLFRYNKDNSRFELDEHFPGYNTPIPSEKVGCVYLDERISSRDGYEYTEWCTSPGTAKWTESRRCSQATNPACYNKIHDYEFNWHHARNTNGSQETHPK